MSPFQLTFSSQNAPPSLWRLPAFQSTRWNFCPNPTSPSGGASPSTPLPSYPTKDDGDPHCCETFTIAVSKPRVHLTDIPLPHPDLILFIDGLALWNCKGHSSYSHLQEHASSPGLPFTGKGGPVWPSRQEVWNLAILFISRPSCEKLICTTTLRDPSKSFELQIQWSKSKNVLPGSTRHTTKRPHHNSNIIA